MSATAFFEPDGDAFRATELTRGPWSPEHQHFGPSAALLGAAIESADGGDDKQVVRITFEILRPVPITTLRTRATVARPGGRVDLVEATLVDGSDTVLAHARAWRMRRHAVDVTPDAVAASRRPSPIPVAPRDASVQPFFLPGNLPGYHTATDWRFVAGAFLEPGPAVAWARLRVPVVAGMDPTPLQRVLSVADSGNGISATAPPTDFVFVNTDLTVHLHALPTGEWVGLDAATTLEAGTGVGLTTTTLHDEHGPIGRSLQSLWLDAPAG